MRSRHRWQMIAAILLTRMVCGAHAALPDEIQVYAFDINDPREFGLELHINTTPSGQRTPAYAAEVITDHGWRVTPELFSGLSINWEAVLYIPMVRSADGSY